MSYYTRNLTLPSDMREHLGLLRGLAMGCKLVVELGFRTGISTSAFLAAGVPVRSYDINAKECKGHVKRLAKAYPKTFCFKVGDSTKIDIPECDLLFLDTDHTYKTTLAELQRHHEQVREWIVLHDTVTFGNKDKPPGRGQGILPAMYEFLADNPYQWRIWLDLPHCNGLIVLKRVT